MERIWSTEFWKLLNKSILKAGEEYIFYPRPNWGRELTLQKMWSAVLLLMRVSLVLIMAGIIFSTAWGVYTRYVLNAAAGWTGEAAAYLLVWLTFLGSALAVVEGGHMAFEGIFKKFKGRVKLVVQVFSLTLLLLFNGVVTYFGTIYALNSLHDTALTFPVSKGLIYSAVPLGGLLMGLGYIGKLVGWYHNERTKKI